MTTYIYGLVDPRDGMVRYVGQTQKEPHVRLSQHIATVKQFRITNLAEWLIPLLEQGERPDVVILDVVPYDDAKEREREWIVRLSEQEGGLANTTFTGRPSASSRQFYERGGTRPPVRPQVVTPEPPTVDELRAFREARGWSQAKLAKALGYHYSTVSLWESGKRDVPPLVRLALERLSD